MAHLFRDLSLGHSKRENTPPPPPITMPTKLTVTPIDLPSSPLGQLAIQLTDSDLRITAYEIFVAACRTSSGKPLSSANSDSPSHLANTNSPGHHSPSSPALQRSLTSAAASKMKKALGLKSPGSKKSPGSGSGQTKPKRPLTVGELMRLQMGVSETVDSRVRRALLRVSASQVSPIYCLGSSCQVCGGYTHQ